jgi:hypothetical protein
MTCSECRDLMLEVARDRAAPLVEGAVLAHAASCAACGSELERERSMTAGLRAVAFLQANTIASSDVESRLLAAFAVRHGNARGQQPLSRLSAGRFERLRVALAAGLILCAAGVTWWLSGSQVVSPRLPPVAAVRPQPPSPVVPSEVAPRDRVPVGHATRPGRRPARPAARSPIQAVGFIPIPSAAGLPEFESGQIVRLGIPVTALPTYGLEIPAGEESSIQADLLVGQDGQPRAIRLVGSASQDLHPRQ